jgi:hypothetical protein
VCTRLQAVVEEEHEGPRGCNSCLRRLHGVLAPDTTGKTACADGPAPSAQSVPPSAQALPTVTVGVAASAQLASGSAQAPSA